MSSYKDYRLSADTTEDAEQRFFELLQKKTPAEKLQMVSRMNATVRALSMSGLRERYPDESELLLKRRLAEMLYGAEVAERIFEKLKEFHGGE
jgi:3-methyladenine DNA glycosylase AlkC